MDLLDLKLDLNVEASSSSRSDGNATKSTPGRKKTETPTTSKTTPKQKWAKRFSSSSTAVKEKEPSDNSNTPTRGAAVLEDVVNPDSTNLTDSGRRARMKSFKRFSPTPQSSVVKKKSNISSPKRVIVNGEVSMEGALKNTVEECSKIGIVEYSIDKTWKEKPSQRCLSFIRSLSNEAPKSKTKGSNVSTPTPVRTASTPRSSNRKITPNARFPAVNLSSPSTNSANLSKDNAIHGKEQVKKTEEVQESDDDEFKPPPVVVKKRGRSSMPAKKNVKAKQESESDDRSKRADSEPRFEMNRKNYKSTPPNICRSRQAMKSSQAQVVVKKTEEKTEEKSVKSVTSENEEGSSTTPRVISRPRRSSVRVPVPPVEIKKEELPAERSSSVEQIVKMETEENVEPKPVVRIRKGSVRTPILKLNTEKKQSESVLPTISTSTKSVVEDVVFAEPLAGSVSKRRSSARSSTRNSSSEEPALSPAAYRVSEPKEVTPPLKEEVFTEPKKVERPRRSSVRISAKKEKSQEVSPVPEDDLSRLSAEKVASETENMVKVEEKAETRQRRKSTASTPRREDEETQLETKTENAVSESAPESAPEVALKAEPPINGSRRSIRKSNTPTLHQQKEDSPSDSSSTTKAAPKSRDSSETPVETNGKGTDKTEVGKRPSRSSILGAPKEITLVDSVSSSVPVPEIKISVRDASPQLEDESNVRRSGRARVVTDKMKELGFVSAPKSPKSPVEEPESNSAAPINPKSALAIRQRLANSDFRKSKDRRSLVRKAGSEEKEEVKGKKIKMTPNGKETTPPSDEVPADEVPVPSPAKEVPKKPKVERSAVEYLDEPLEASKSPESKHSEESMEIQSEVSTSESMEGEKKTPPKPAPASKQSAKKPVVAAPVRSSNRVSKPNKLFSEDYDIPTYSQKTNISKSNEVVSTSEPIQKVRRSSESSPAPVVPKLKLRIKLGGVDIDDIEAPMEQEEVVVEKKKESASVEPEEPLIRNGVLVGYTPSIKPLLGFITVDGVIEPIGMIVESVMDKLLFDVCQDGVEKHSDIVNAPVIKFSKSSRKGLVERRARVEAKRLEINMSSAMSPQPVAEQVETVKRRRHAPKLNEDFMYTSLKTRTKDSTTKHVDRASTDSKDPDYEYDEKEWKQQEARDFLSETIAKEMEDAIAETSSREHSNFELRREKKKGKKKPQLLQISLNEYMKERNVMNRPDCGIKLYDDSGSTPKNDDFFFHELLTDYPEPEEEEIIDPENTFVDMEVPVEDEDPIERHLNLLLKCHGDSIRAADQIEKLMARKYNLNGSQFTLEDMLERAAEQPEQRRKLLYNAMTIVRRQYILETTPAARNHNFEAALFNTTNSNANKLKNIFTMFDLPQKESVFWVHKFFIEELPVHFLAPYLALLKYAKPMTSSYIGYIVKSTSDEGYPWDEMTQLISHHVSIKPNDPELDSLNMTIIPNQLDDVIFLIVSPTLMIGDFHNKPRAPETIYKWLRTLGNAQSELIRAKDDEDYESNVAEFVAENMLDVVIDKIEKKRVTYPNHRIVLVGFGWTTYVIHRAANLTSGVSAIISLGFPVVTEDGRRGVPDDDILITYCPTLFVVGAESEYYDSIAMKDMRSSMINPSGLIVVGHANDQLLVSPSVLVRLGVTQKVVYRLILEKVIAFLQLEETRWERTKLCPNELNNVFVIDPILYRSDKMQQQAGLLPSPASAVLTPSATNMRRSTISVLDDPVRASAQPLLKKKKTEFSMNSPSLDRARQQFSESMKVAKISESRTVSLDSPRAVERGDLRERSLTTPNSVARAPMPKPVFPQFLAANPSSLVPAPRSPAIPPPPPQPKGPIDPASISLV